MILKNHQEQKANKRGEGGGGGEELILNQLPDNLIRR